MQRVEEKRTLPHCIIYDVFSIGPVKCICCNGLAIMLTISKKVRLQGLAV